MSVYTTTIEVATETGDTALIGIDRDDIRDTYAIEFSGLLLDQTPEAVTASVQIALLTIRAQRKEGQR